ncbi:hypothetical protein [Dictyobacter formicarum]|uniref:Knr4/Smi1-like domain-containing protein n=1 Tax=Dictyobacter formicarum TaxID=2778368 RepID=A0ABQ3VU50_9CHLR|nr:hypothetical protein [Dictyobacter formicarum]GHO89407.1 hypothetical protein KSZ_74130 [Dictyobacter formicarum]
MELDWSTQSPHIRSLYPPWQSGDGYEENIIQATEARLGSRLPTPLRTFYSTWGRRKDLTRLNQALVGPDKLVARPDALIFCFENQAVCSWAIRHEDLEKANPPVVVAYALPDWEWWEVDAPLIWMPSHTHVSDFLDTLTYHHALCGGAIHGGYTHFFHHQEYQNAWLEQQWQRTTVGPLVFGLVEDFSDDLPPLYVRNGQALAWFLGCSVAVRKMETLDEISQALQVTWVKQW